MPKTMRGPGLFLAQFADDAAPFDSLDAICGWAAGLGYKGVQIPTWDSRLIDLAKAAGSKTYADEVAGTVARHGLAITELSTHLQGQLVAVNPAFDEAFDAFAPPTVQGNPSARQAWAVEQLKLGAQASQNPCDRAGVRRFRRHGAERRAQPTHAGHKLTRRECRPWARIAAKRADGASVLAWSAAEKALSSVRCIALRHGSMTISS